MLVFQTAARLVTACVERTPQRNADGEIVLLNVGLMLINESRRPLGYEIVKVTSEVEGCSHVAPVSAGEASGEIVEHAAKTIDLGLALDRPMQAGMVLRGTLQATVRYGAAGRFHETLELDFALNFKALSASEIAAFGWRAV